MHLGSIFDAQIDPRKPTKTETWRHHGGSYALVGSRRGLLVNLEALQGLPEALECEFEASRRLLEAAQ